MTNIIRWTIAALMLFGAFVFVFRLHPTTCHVDICTTNVGLDIDAYVAAVVGVILVLTVRRR